LDTNQLARLSGVEKAAILLLSLGEEATSKIFEDLDDPEVRMISRCMMGLDHVPEHISKQVLDLFEKTREEYAGIFVRGDEFVRKAISKGGNDQRKTMLLEQLAAGPSFRPLETIAMMQPRMVASLLENEHPQTVALILSTQTPEHTSKIIEYLPEELKGAVIHRIARIEKVSPEVLNQIEESLRHEIGLMVNREQQQVGGVDKVVDILGRLSKGKDQVILEEMEDTDPSLADEIRKKMFTFEDLIFIDDRGLQSILREINNDTLVMAMKTGTDEIKAKFFSNIASRAAEMIQDDLEAMGPARLEDVETAQQEIVQVALKLETEGKIVIPGRGVNDVLV